jgi:hypothetical protein
MTTADSLLGRERPSSLGAAREVVSRAGSVVDYTPSPADWQNEVL